MRRAHRDLVRTSLFMLGLALGGGRFIAACQPASAPTPKLPDYCYDEKAFQKELVGCVAAATDKSASRECRRIVHASCGFVMTSSASTELP